MKLCRRECSSLFSNCNSLMAWEIFGLQRSLSPTQEKYQGFHLQYFTVTIIYLSFVYSLCDVINPFPSRRITYDETLKDKATCLSFKKLYCFQIKIQTFLPVHKSKLKEWIHKHRCQLINTHYLFLIVSYFPGSTTDPTPDAMTWSSRMRVSRGTTGSLNVAWKLPAADKTCTLRCTQWRSWRPLSHLKFLLVPTQ